VVAVIPVLLTERISAYGTFIIIKPTAFALPLSVSVPTTAYIFMPTAFAAALLLLASLFSCIWHLSCLCPSRLLRCLLSSAYGAL